IEYFETLLDRATTSPALPRKSSRADPRCLGPVIRATVRRRGRLSTDRQDAPPRRRVGRCSASSPAHGPFPWSSPPLRTPLFTTVWWRPHSTRPSTPREWTCTWAHEVDRAMTGEGLSEEVVEIEHHPWRFTHLSVVRHLL